MISFLKIVKKIVFFAIVVIFFFFLFSRGVVYDKKDLEYGVTFSKKQAEDLNLDWKKLYDAIFVDLGVKKIRLAAYWDEVQKEEGQYNWEDLDWQIERASEAGAEIILAAGVRLPRWPECHIPDWTENLEQTKKNEKTLSYIEAVINRYKDKKNITAWQIENEPFLSHFGECPPLDKNFLDQEIALVKKLDSRPIVVTDSGELSVWVQAASRADIFGTTMYRDTYSKTLEKYIHYPIAPGFFRFKKNLTRFFAHPQKWIVIELQGEPWGPKFLKELSQEEKDRTMDINKFTDILEFSRLAGFKEFYLWGVEWWYWEKEINGNDKFWEEARWIF